MAADSLTFQQLTTPSDVTPQLQRALAECWVEVTNAGGAAGFPFPPVDAATVAPTLVRIIDLLSPDANRLLTATLDGELAGWLCLRRDQFELIAHWGTLHHVQTRTAVRGRGIGLALMHEVRRIARDEMGLEQLHLAARGGVVHAGHPGQSRRVYHDLDVAGRSGVPGHDGDGQDEGAVLGLRALVGVVHDERPGGLEPQPGLTGPVGGGGRGGREEKGDEECDEGSPPPALLRARGPYRHAGHYAIRLRRPLNTAPVARTWRTCLANGPGGRA
ncbi:GNAT family N-acetyltransferase [Streptomyces mirabilis]|uniref:GNAT family N-acetyltransferase n=1 Tax=Streptomyces mirabilis TaxID=68239 RepID=UPI0036DDB639